MIKEFNKENPIVIGQNPVLLDFYAEWCGPCKVTGKYIEEFSELHPDIVIYKINVDTYENIAEKYGVLSLPTIICSYTPYLENDKELWRHVGLMTLKQLEDKIYGNSNISS